MMEAVDTRTPRIYPWEYVSHKEDLPEVRTAEDKLNMLRSFLIQKAVYCLYCVLRILASTGIRNKRRPFKPRLPFSFYQHPVSQTSPGEHASAAGSLEYPSLCCRLSIGPGALSQNCSF